MRFNKSSLLFKPRLIPKIRATTKIFLWLCWTIILVLGYFLLVTILRIKIIRYLVRLYFKVSCKILSIRIKIEGDIVQKPPIFFISNHSSWLDIMVLGAVVPASFTPKSEIASWPAIGVLTKMSDAIFIDRRRNKTQENYDKLVKHFTNRKNIILFAEGTTGDAIRILPFKSSYLALVTDLSKAENLAKMHIEHPPALQNILITPTYVENLPMDRANIHYYGWIGDTDLASHFWKLVQLSSIEVSINFMPEIDLEQYLNSVPNAQEKLSASNIRKQITNDCYRQINLKLDEVKKHA